MCIVVDNASMIGTQGCAVKSVVIVTDVELILAAVCLWYVNMVLHE
jgi:hypothetical protein